MMIYEEGAGRAFGAPPRDRPALWLGRQANACQAAFF
jgi:hypothetical protein